MSDDLKLVQKYFLPLQFSKGEKFFPCDLFFAGDDITKNWYRYTRIKRPLQTYYYHVNRYPDGSIIIQYWFYFAYNIYPFATGPGKIAINSVIGDNEKNTRDLLVNKAIDPNSANRLIQQTDNVAEIPIRDIFINFKAMLTVMDNHDHDFEKILVFLNPDGKPTDVLLNHHLERFHYSEKEIEELGYPFLVYVEQNSHGFAHTTVPPFVYCGDGELINEKDCKAVSMADLKAQVVDIENRGIPVYEKTDNSLICHDKAALKVVVPWERDEFEDPRKDRRHIAVVDVIERLGVDYDSPFVTLFNRAFIGLASQIMPLCGDSPGIVTFISRFMNKLTSILFFWRK